MRLNSGSRIAWAIILIALCTILVFATTFGSMVRTSVRSETYYHCLMVLPICGLMIWQYRIALSSAVLGKSSLGLICLLAAVGAWFLSSLVHVQVGQQLAVIAIFVSTVWFVLGNSVAAILKFPLLFAFFSVPFGESLVPPLMQWTAGAAIVLLNISGVPVHSDGLLLHVPAGSFEVVEACSGVRYLIVGLVLATLFSHYTYSSFRKGCAFVLAVGFAVVAANGLRAYLVILIANATEMRWGTDHHFFGLVIFGITLAAAFFVGHRFRDGDSAVEPKAHPAEQPTRMDRSGRYGLSSRLFVALCVMFLGPSILFAMSPRHGSADDPMLPVASNGWAGPSATEAGYTPAVEAGSRYLSGRYASEFGDIELHIVWFGDEEQDRELVGYHSRFYDRAIWRATATDRVPVPVSDKTMVPLDLHLMENRSGRRLALASWYDIGGVPVAGRIPAKLLQLRKALRRVATGDAMIVLVWGIEEESEQRIRDDMKRFVSTMYDSIQACLRPVADATANCAATASGS